MEPDLTLLFEIPVATASRDAENSRWNKTGDHEAHEFHEKVRRGFLALAARAPQRIKKIDGLPHPETVTVEVTSVIQAFLTKARTKRLTAVMHTQRMRPRRRS